MNKYISTSSLVKLYTWTKIYGNIKSVVSRCVLLTKKVKYDENVHKTLKSTLFSTYKNELGTWLSVHNGLFGIFD